MASAPRIVRAMPKGSITRPEHGIPVFALLRWANGADHAVPAIAVAWTLQAVQIEWEAPGYGQRSDWIPAADIRRAGSPPPPSDPGRPLSRAGRKNSW